MYNKKHQRFKKASVRQQYPNETLEKERISLVACLFRCGGTGSIVPVYGAFLKKNTRKLTARLINYGL